MIDDRDGVYVYVSILVRSCKSSILKLGIKVY